MPSCIRKIATSLVIVAMMLAPTLSEAAQYNYFRMYGGGGNVFSGPAMPPPAGALSYSIAGATTTTVGVPYSASSSVVGAIGATTFFLNSGSLPTGLVLNPSTGAISGTPMVAGTYSSVVEVRDANNFQGLAAFSLTVAVPFVVAGSPSAFGTVGMAYSAQFSGAGGSAPYGFSTSSLLPPGLSLSSSGLLSGVPSVAGTYSDIVVQAADSGSRTASSTPFSVVISDPVAVSWIPASGQVGVAYSPSAPSVSGGQSPYLYSLNGFAPDGLTFNNATGMFAGVPQTEGTYSVSVTVIDRDGRFASTGAKTVAIAPGEIVNNPGPLAISGTPGIAAQQGIGYSSHFTASGGSQAGYVFDLAAGSLPPGLSLSSSGIISGTPSALGVYSGIQVRVTDSVSDTALSGIFSITVSAPPALIIAGNPSSAAQVGSNYSATFSAFEGTGTGYTFSSVGNALPPGLTLANVNGTDGLLTGVPTQVGTYSGLQVRVTDSGGHTADSSVFSITVVAPAGPALVIAGSPQNFNDVGAVYAATLVPSGGTGSGYSFSISSGTLPTGLSLSPDGVISGTTITAQSRIFTVMLADSAGSQAQATYTIVVSPPLELAAVPMPHATTGAFYDFTLGATGGRAPYRFTLTGALPPGITLDTNTGRISGTTTVHGPVAYPVSIAAIDVDGRTATRGDSLRVYDPLVVVFAAPGGAVGEPYSYQPTITGGSQNYASITTIPAGQIEALGLTLNPTTGLISGTPTSAGSANFSFRVIDSGDGETVDVPSAHVNVNPALSISGTPPAGANVGVAYVAPFTASGGTTPRAFAIASGSLPAWLTLDSSTGILSGTPSSSDTGTVGPLAVKVTDAGGAASTSPAFLIEVMNSVALAGTPSPTLQGAGYSFDLTTLTSGGTAPYSYSVVSGALPAGMSLASNGVVSAPQVTGTSQSVSIQVTDSASSAATASLSFVVDAATASAVPLASAYRSGASIIGSLATSLSTPVWSFSQTPSSPSLGLSGSGSAFSGMAPSVATQTVYSSIVATATEGAVHADAPPFLLTVNPALVLTGGPTADISGATGTEITATPSVGYGNTNISANPTLTLMQAGSPVALSSLCPGLSFSTANGVISGTPTGACSLSALSIGATDSDGATASAASFAIEITTPTAAASRTSPSTVRAGVPVTGSLTTNLSTATWSFVNEPTPAGQPALILTPSGSTSSATFTGTAPAVTQSTSYSIVATATSGQSSANAAVVTQTVLPALTVSGGPSGKNIGYINQATTLPTPTNSGVQQFATWSLVQNGSTTVNITTLCPGLSLNSVNGIISGTPTSACNQSNLQLKVTDSADGASGLGPTFQMLVGTPLASSGTAATSATTNSAYSAVYTASGASGSYSWSISGAPSWMTATPSGTGNNTYTLSGTPPTATTTGTITVTLTDAGAFGTSITAQMFTITSTAPVAPSEAALTSVTFGPGGGSVQGAAVTAKAATTTTNPNDAIVARVSGGVGNTLNLNYSGPVIASSVSLRWFCMSAFGTTTFQFVIESSTDNTNWTARSSTSTFTYTGPNCQYSFGNITVTGFTGATAQYWRMRFLTKPNVADIDYFRVN